MSKNQGKKSYWIISALYSFSERFSILIFGLLSFKLLVKILSKEEFGVWVLFITTINIIELVRNGLIKSPMIRFRLEPGISKSKVDFSALLLNIIVTFVLLGVITLISPLLSKLWEVKELNELFLIYLIGGIATTFLSHAEFLQHANMSFKGVFISYFIQKGLFVVLLGYYYFFDQGVSLIQLGWYQVGINFFAAIVAMFLSKNYIEKFEGIDKGAILRMLNYGKFTSSISISSMIIRNIDKWMLGAFMGPVSVATYDAAIRISNLMDLPSTSLANILFPKAVAKVKAEGKRAAAKLYTQSAMLIFWFMVPAVVFIILFADYAIILFADKSYLDSVPILRVTMLYGLIIPFNRQLGVILDVMGKASLNLTFVIRNAIMNIILNYFFILQFGIIGAAYATLTTFVISLIINQIYLKKLLEIRVIDYWVSTVELKSFVLDKIKNRAS